VNFAPFIATGIGLGAVYGMSAVGLVVLYRSSGTINFAFGALGAVAAHVAWTLIEHNTAVWLAWLCGIVLAALLSFLYGRYVSSRLTERSQSVRAIATLGLALFLLGIITTIWGPGLPRRLSLPTDFMNVYIFGMKISYTRLGAFAFALISMIALGLLLSRTRIGLAMRSLASSRSISGQIGIDVATVDSAAWLISGAFAGIAGLLLADLLLMSPIPLTFLVIPALAAAVLGRLTSMVGAFIGGMAAGLAEALLTAVPLFVTVRSAAPYVIALVFITLVIRTPSAEQE
jgi:branched-chain amino acid transport system permease protein